MLRRTLCRKFLLKNRTMATVRQASLQRARYKKAISQQDIDSSRTEPFRTGVPHRLPLPPLLSAPTPSGPSLFFTGTSQGAIKPVPRRPLAPEPTLTVMEPTEGAAPVKAYGCPRQVSNSLLSDLKLLSQACGRASRPLAEALCYWNMAVEYEAAFLLKEAIAYFRKFIFPCVRAGYTPGVVAGLSSIASALYCQGNYSEAITACETALEAVPEAIHVCESTTGGWVTSSLAAASLLNTIGLCFTQLLDYEAATVAFSRALQHSLQVADQRVEKAICANQASANALVGDFAKAESCLERHIELSNTLGAVSERNVETTLGLKGLESDEYQAMGPPDATSRTANALETSAVLSRLGSLARVHGEYESSRQFYQRAYNLAIRSGDFEHAVTASCAIGLAKGTESIKETLSAIQQESAGIEEANDYDLESVQDISKN